MGCVVEREVMEVLSLTFSVAHSELVVPSGQSFELTAVDRVAWGASVSAERLHCWRVQVLAKVCSGIASSLQQVAIVCRLERVDGRIHSHATTCYGEKARRV
jgi:hypothetical protein